MSRLDDRALAVRLDRVLDGREPAEGELRALAVVLEQAAGPARFEVEPEAVESALARTPRPAARRARLRRPAFAIAGAAALGLAVIAVVLTRSPGLHIEDEALAALGGPAGVLRVVERIEPAARGTFPVSVRVGWIDQGGARTRWDQYVRGRLVAQTLVERGRVSRFLLAENAVIVGATCRAFASGCAELVDPIDFYRRALQSGSARTVRSRVEGRAVYVLSLPVQSLPDAVRIRQRVTVDGRTYLPLRIEWLDEQGRSFAVIRIRRVVPLPRGAGLSVFQLTVAANVRVVQRVVAGRELRKLGERLLTEGEAGRLNPPLRWLGPSFFGEPVVSIHEVHWNAGNAYRIRYGARLTLWNYGALVPPEIASTRYVPAKTIPIRGGVVRFYVALDGRLVAELEGAERSVALIGPDLGKIDFFRALEQLRPLR